jgi:Transposase DDE domain
MTMVLPCLPRVKRQIDSQLDALLPHSFIHQTLRQSGHCFRIRALSPGLSVHLLLIQLLHNTALEALRHLTSTCVSASAICQARAQLPLSLFYCLVEEFTASALKECQAPAKALFHDFQVMLLDATSLRTQDTPELASCYGKHSNQRRISPGYPAPKLLCLMNYATGLITRAITLPACRQEHMLLRRIAALLCPGQILVADRGLVSFPFICEALKAGAHVCLRLPQRQIAGLSGKRRLAKTLGSGDALVTWSKGSCSTKAYSRKDYLALEETLTLRQITWQATRPGFRATGFTVITTLLDPERYPAADLADLYMRRWQVETYFRDLKCTQGAKCLRARKLAGMKKELLAHVLLYNLIRQVMHAAATRQNTLACRISFIAALRYLKDAAAGLEHVLLKINPIRQRLAEPRRVKTRRSKYPPLNKPRNDYKKPHVQLAA